MPAHRLGNEIAPIRMGTCAPDPPVDGPVAFAVACLGYE